MRQSKYHALAAEYLELNRWCVACARANILRPAVQVHHQRKRGVYLLRTEYFLAVCYEHHRKIEDNPEWAYAQGYSIRRNSLEEGVDDGDGDQEDYVSSE